MKVVLANKNSRFRIFHRILADLFGGLHDLFTIDCISYGCRQEENVWLQDFQLHQMRFRREQAVNSIARVQ